MSKLALRAAVIAAAGILTAATTSHPTSTHASHPKSAAASSKSGKSQAHRKTTASRPYVSTQPSPERYQQIQRALAEKGYFSGEPNGRWGTDSVEALKRFQNDQNLTADGKLNSLSLIALGLGPKRISTPPAPAVPTSSEPGVRP